MVARIEIGRSLRTALNYNERKVEQNRANLLDAGYYHKDADELTFHEKLIRLQKRIDLNSGVKVNVLHISLNFAPGEKVPKEQLREIGRLYLHKIGFFDQPYLLYEHMDAAHPHVHILTTNIKANGSAISLHNIGRIHSEKARKEIQEQFSLVNAGGQKRQPYEPEPVRIQPTIYGQAETKRAIGNVLRHVLTTYRYASLPELNAVLSQYNVIADRGAEGSRTYKRGGLVYRLLDGPEGKVGVGIKASSFHFKPTLKHLSSKFEKNKVMTVNYRSRLKNTIDLALREKQTLQSLSERLEKEGVRMVLRKSAQGLIYGCTYIDHRTRCVFNGSELGKAYAAKGILERCTPVSGKQPAPPTRPLVSRSIAQLVTEPYQPQEESDFNGHPKSDRLLEDLMMPHQDHSGLPWQLRKKSARKKRRIV